MATHRKPSPTTLRAPPPPTEHAEQAALITWAGLQTAKIPELALLFAIPNGGARSRAAAGKLKAEGVKPGVPDLFLPVARGSAHGLFLELKRTQKSHTSPEQKAWHIALQAQGYHVVVVKGAEAAQAALRAYLAGTLPATPTDQDPALIPPPGTPRKLPPKKTRPHIPPAPWMWRNAIAPP